YRTQLNRWGRTCPQPLNRFTYGYGRTELFVVVDTNFLQDVCDAAEIPNLRVEPLVLAAISPIPTFTHVKEGNMVRYTLPGRNLATPEIINANDIDSLVGRVRTQHGA
ncbi:hypothetical protein FRC12_006825, partial [Ceratobasidium sp. 428]